MNEHNYNAQNIEDMIEGKRQKRSGKPIIAVCLAVAVSLGVGYAAFSYGRNAGYNEGYEVGRDDGYETGAKEGHKEGYNEGYETGYNNALSGDTARKYQLDLSEDEIEALAKAAQEANESNYEKYADIIADGYDLNAN